MKKIIILKGLPASGKSTLAKKLVLENTNHIRINRDDLRSMAFESVWSGKREKIIIALEQAIAQEALGRDWVPIIDDTNLRGSLWEDFAKAEGADVEIQDLRSVSPEECILKDYNRDFEGKSVGPGVIYNMALRAGLCSFNKPFIICDIDGTLADLSHRVHFLDQTPKDYGKFYNTIYKDSPIHGIIEWVKALAEEHDVVYCSGRPSNVGNVTMGWIYKQGLPDGKLFMRNAGDHRPDYIIKNEILALLPKDKIVFAIDDRPSVIEKVWRKNNIKVYPVNAEHWEGKE